MIMHPSIPTASTMTRRFAPGLRAALTACALALVIAAPPAADGAVLRYALVIGNDLGVDADGAERTLRHAEAEAARLRVALIACCGFSDTARTLLLQRPTRADFHRAVETIRAAIRSDRALIPDARVLFTLFYSGHATRGTLLLADGPLPAHELTAAVRDTPADMRVGVLDACASASLTDDDLLEKGMTPLPSFDLIGELPERELNTEGIQWLFSSGPDEKSFEDATLGGVFTHFFTEALTRAPSDGYGITLDAIWDYARTRTTTFANRHARAQTPVRVNRTVAKGPLHFSLRPQRPSILVLGPEVFGKVALYYAGDLLLAFDKVAGTTLEKRVPSGTADIIIVKGDARQTIDGARFAPGARVFVDPHAAVRPTPRFGRALTVAKGADADLHVLVEDPDATTFLLGAGYGSAVGPDVLLAPLHTVSLAARLDHGPWVAGLSVGYGFDDRAFSAWGYDADGVVVGGRFGYGVDLGSTRLAAHASGSYGALWQRFDDGASRRGHVVSAGGGLSAAFDLGAALVLEAHVDGAARQTKGAGDGSTYRWSPVVHLGAALLVAL